VNEEPEWAESALERTQLAWNRTGLAGLAAGVAVVRRLWEQVDARNVVAVVFTVIGVVALVGLAGWMWARAAGAHAGGTGPQTARPRAMRRIAVGTAAFSGAALVLAVLPYRR